LIIELKFDAVFSQNATALATQAAIGWLQMAQIA